MFYNIKVSSPERMKLLSAVNDKDEKAWLKNCRNVSLSKAIESIAIGSASYFKMPLAARWCLSSIFSESDITDFLPTIYRLTDHFESDKLSEIFLELATEKQLRLFLDWLIHCESWFVFMSMAFTLPEHFDWNMNGTEWLEKAYAAGRSNGWLGGITHFLENKGIRVSDTFQTNLKWHSRLSPSHQLTSTIVLNRFIDETIKKDKMLSSAPLLAHKNHMYTTIAWTILCFIRPWSLCQFSKEQILKVIPDDIKDEFKFNDHGCVTFISDSPLLEKFTYWVECEKEDLNVTRTEDIPGKVKFKFEQFELSDFIMD